MTTAIATHVYEPDSTKLIANRYKIERTLGSGNCGTAFLTLDEKENKERKVIKKICIGNLALGDTVNAANEGKLLKGLQHPHIITYFDSFIHQEFYCIVTEFCNEGDLDSKIEENKKERSWLKEETITTWLTQILMALEYIHSRNIFIKQGNVKLGDFGISRMLSTPTEMADTFIGTPFYMSPEVLNHRGYNTKSDIWSVGCVLYDLATFEHPFKGNSLVSIISNILHATHPPWPDRYSSQLGDLFIMLTERDQSRRPSAHQALNIPFIHTYHQALQKKNERSQDGMERETDLTESNERLLQSMKQKTHLVELKMESEMRQMLPRDRIRLRKIIKADQEARKIRDVVSKQHRETHEKYAAIRQTLSPFHSSITLGALGENSRKTKSWKEEGRASLPYLPDNAESADCYYGQFEDFESDGEEEEEDEFDSNYGEEKDKLSKNNQKLISKTFVKRKKISEHEVLFGSECGVGELGTDNWGITRNSDVICGQKISSGEMSDEDEKEEEVKDIEGDAARGKDDEKEDEIAEEIEGITSDASTLEEHGSVCGSSSSSGGGKSGSCSDTSDGSISDSESKLISSFKRALDTQKQ